MQFLHKASLQNFHGSIFADASDHAHHYALYNYAYIVALQEPRHIILLWLRDHPGSQASHEVRIYDHKNVH